MADGGSYTMFSKGPAVVAGLMAIPEAMRAEGLPPCWFGYVSTDDGDAWRVEAAAGAIRRPPTDSRMSDAAPVLSDPGGAVFLLLKSKTTEEPKPVAPTTSGHIRWHELMVGYPEREFAFKSGWTKDRAHDMAPMGTYQTFATGGVPCGAR